MGYKTGVKKGGGGAEQVLAMLKEGGGHKTFWGNFYTVTLSFSFIKGGGCKMFSTFERGGVKSVTSVLRRGGHNNVSDGNFFIFTPHRWGRH